MIRPADLSYDESVAEAWLIAKRNSLRWGAGVGFAPGKEVTERLWMWVRTMGDLKDRFEQLRKQSRRFATTGAEVGTLPPPGHEIDPAEAGIQRADLREAMSILSKRVRTIVEAIYFGGMTQVEVADKMKISQPAVSQALDRAFTKMRSVLGEKYNVG